MCLPDVTNINGDLNLVEGFGRPGALVENFEIAPDPGVRTSLLHSPNRIRDQDRYAGRSGDRCVLAVQSA